MDFVYMILGTVLLILFFFNIRNAADALCRIIGGFAGLMAYSSLSAFLPLITPGINLITSALTGFLGVPGMLLIILCKKFL